MLAAYRTQTQGLLQNPSAPTTLYSTTDIDRWVNIARGQLAGEAECIRILGTIDTVADQRNYDFNDINIGVVATTGAAGVIHVRSILYGVGDGQQWITPRSWEWFQLYHMNNPVPTAAAPTAWAQYGQGAGAGGGSGATGSFYLDPPPDLAYTLTCDCVCFPASLADDSTVEAIPYFWTDAVPFFAAYYALLSSQTSQRQGEASRYFQTYTEFVERARKFSNPSVNRTIYPQSPDPTVVQKLGMQRATGGQGG